MHVGRVRALALLLILALAAVGRDARADTFTDALAGFAKNSFSDTIAAVEAIAASGDARAASVLRALAEGNLYVRKSDQAVVFTREDGGKTLGTEAASGKDLGEFKSDDYDQVRLNNRVRSVVQAALGTFNLVHPDARTRIEAARALFRAPDAKNIPLLQKSLEKESDPAVRAAKGLALAASRLMSDNDAERLAGIVVLKGTATPEVRDLLLRIAGQAEKGSPEGTLEGCLHHHRSCLLIRWCRSNRATEALVLIHASSRTLVDVTGPRNERRTGPVPSRFTAPRKAE